MQDSHGLLLVTAVALRAENGRILMQRRRQDRIHGGLWEFPGGKVEPGESPEVAIIREIDEELGIALDEMELSPLAFASGPADPPVSENPLVILLYTCRKWHGEPECRDGEEIRWFLPEELSSLDMPPLDRPLARALLGAIGSATL